MARICREMTNTYTNLVRKLKMKKLCEKLICRRIDNVAVVFKKEVIMG
jgi:hypothetical protein